MRVLRSIPELASLGGPACLAIGVFDGVHRGHQALLTALLSAADRLDGIPVVVTFEPHPLAVLRPDSAPATLTPTAHKLRLLERHGVDHALVLPFTPEFGATPPELFIRDLHAHATPLRLIAVGHRWEFGHRRSGNVALLEALGGQLGFQVIELAPVLEDNEPVSSTRIRQAVKDGNLAHAATLLGRPFSVIGNVVHGDQRGRQIGFPTLNLHTFTDKLPPPGVYAGACDVDGVSYRAAINLGTRPTVDGRTISLEAHLIDFTGDLYDHEVELEFGRKLRDEQRFASLDELRAQIAKDVAEVG